MSKIVEVVFEDVDKTDVRQFLETILSNSEKIESIECIEDVTFLNDGELANSISELFRVDKDISLLVNLKSMKIGNITLSEILLRLVKYENKYDIDFSFDVEKIASITIELLFNELHLFAKRIVAIYKINSFFFVVLSQLQMRIPGTLLKIYGVH